MYHVSCHVVGLGERCWIPFKLAGISAMSSMPIRPIWAEGVVLTYSKRSLNKLTHPYDQDLYEYLITNWIIKKPSASPGS